MKQLIESLGCGNPRSLLACFLYFDTGFTAWVMFGALAPFIATDLALSPSESAFLVAVPVLAASIMRVTLGNLLQAVDGRRLALCGIALSAAPSLALLVPAVPGYSQLLVLGAFLGIAGASFAVALPVAGSSYPARVQGLVLGLAAAGNVGAVIDGFVFPAIAERMGWQRATLAVLPLLALAAAAVYAWADDRGAKSGSVRRAFAGSAAAFAALIGLVLLVGDGAFGRGRAGPLLLPVMGSLAALAVLPGKYRAVLAEADTWVVMLVYAVTFGGFVGMSSYVTLLLTNQYGISRVGAGLVMAAMSFTGAMVRPLGGFIADRISGVRALLALLAGIAVCDFTFAALMPPLAGGIVLLAALYLCFGLGNGATFQLVPHRWRDKQGLMTGIIGAAGGIGGFYLPVVMGIARASTGSYQLGFATFGAVAALALLLVAGLQQRWLHWALPGRASAAASGALVFLLLAASCAGRCARAGDGASLIEALAECADCTARGSGTDTRTLRFELEYILC